MKSDKKQQKNSNQSPVDYSHKRRLMVLAIVIFAAFALLIAQFYRIQIIEGKKWVAEGDKQHYFIIKEPFLRGIFYSNTSIKKGHPEKPQPFVVDIQKFHLYIDPDSIPEECREEIASQIQCRINLPADEEKYMRAQFDIKSRSRKLTMWLDKESHDTVMEWWLPYAHEHHIPRNALFFMSDYQRSYPFGKLLGQILHTIQNVKNEVTKQALPTGGLELHLNGYLKGKQGKRRLVRSPRNAFETGEVIESPENGADIYLTINHVLQAIAEDELAKGVIKAKAKTGWAVMMNPRTGEILALAQYPFFNPPEYPLYFSDPKLIDDTRVKAVTDANEPGSVMKPFTLVIALLANEELKKRGEAELFTLEEKIATGNGHFRGRKKPIKDTHFHSFLNMRMALQKSSNIYMARLMERVVDRLGDDWYRSQLHETFGFGKKTGIEFPGESRGVLPMPGKKHPNGAFEWSTPTPFSLAIGHNIQTNSLQLAAAYAMLANGGYRVKPTLIRKIIKKRADGTEEVLLDNTLNFTIDEKQRVVSKEIIDTVTTAMKYVTKPGGSARRADIPGYTEAGKTGTPEKIVDGKYVQSKHCPSFIGFAPFKEPAFVLLVTMDEPEVGYEPGVGKKHMGGFCAAPVFREIAKRSLEYLGIPPDDPHGYPVGDPRHDANKADWAKELRELQSQYEIWNHK